MDLTGLQSPEVLQPVFIIQSRPTEQCHGSQQLGQARPVLDRSRLGAILAPLSQKWLSQKNGFCCLRANGLIFSCPGPKRSCGLCHRRPGPSPKTHQSLCARRGQEDIESTDAKSSNGYPSRYKPLPAACALQGKLRHPHRRAPSRSEGRAQSLEALSFPKCILRSKPWLWGQSPTL